MNPRDPSTRYFGAFDNPKAAQDWIGAGQVPKEFPYFGVFIVDAGYFIVASDTMTQDEMWAKSRRNVVVQELDIKIMLGPFEQLPNEEMLQEALSKFKTVMCICISLEQAKQLKRA